MPPLEIGVKSQSKPAAASYSEYLLRIADIQFDATRLSPFDPKPTPKIISMKPHFSLLPDAGDFMKLMSVWTSGSALWATTE
jgi:hypothetical protein